MRRPKQANRMQILQPLAVRHIRFTARYIFRMAGIHQPDAKAMVFQDLEQWNPKHTGGLHYDTLNATLLQPGGDLLKFASERCKAADRLRIAVRRYSYEDFGCADVNSGSIGLHDPRYWGGVGLGGVLPLGHVISPDRQAPECAGLSSLLIGIGWPSPLACARDSEPSCSAGLMNKHHWRIW